MFNVTDGPWYVDIGAVAAALTSGAIIWRMALFPVFKAFWAAILAAPKIADGVGKVVELIEGDVLNDLDSLHTAIETHIVESDARADVLVAHEQRITILEKVTLHKGVDA